MAGRFLLDGRGASWRAACAKEQIIFLRSHDLGGRAFVPNPGRTPPPADGCCRMRPGCTSIDSLRSTSHHEDSRASDGDASGQSCSSSQLQQSWMRVVGRGGRSDYVEAATDRLLSTAPQRSRMTKDDHSHITIAESGTCSPQSPAARASSTPTQTGVFSTRQGHDPLPRRGTYYSRSPLKKS